MDISKYVSEWLEADSISKDKTNPTKAIIQNQGEEFESKYGKQLVFELEIDGSTVKFRPNSTSLKNIAKKYTNETMTWVGKPIELVAIETLVKGEVRNVVYVL